VNDRTPRGHDLTLLRELQELTPAERLERNWRMAELVEELRAAAVIGQVSEHSHSLKGILSGFVERSLSEDEWPNVRQEAWEQASIEDWKEAEEENT
jgi:hypothetical protein